MTLTFDPDNPKYQYITDASQAEVALRELLNESIVGIDTETTGFDPYTQKLMLVQIGTETMSYIFDARYIPLKDLPIYKEFMENQKILKIFHNGKFDYKFLKIQTGVETANLYDTLLAESVLSAGLVGKAASLKELALSYLEINLDKQIRDLFVDNPFLRMTEVELKYSAIDTLVLFPIMKAQMQRLVKENLVNIAKLEFSVTRVVAEMELRGVLLDQQKWRQIIALLQEKRDKYAIDFQEMIKPYYKTEQFDLFGENRDVINMNSQVQLMDLFNNKLGISVPSTGDPILEKINHPVAKTLRDYRGYEKLISAFGESLLAKINPVTQRIHPDFMQLGAATGRFSCKNPNFQQIPRAGAETPFRECFIPPAGFDLVVCDYSSMEMRILAELSQDPMLCKAIKEGYDLHSHTASLMFDLPYNDEFKKVYKNERQAAKAINFGLVYGMGAQGLAGQLQKPVEEAEALMEKYFKNYPSIKKWLDITANNAVSRGWSATPAGRKRWYNKPDPSDPEYRKRIGKIGREAKNHPIQGANADATKLAMVFIHERLKKDGVEGALILTVHDEVVCEIREDQSHDWAEVQRGEMIRAAASFMKTIPVESEPFVGKIWEH